MTTDTLTDKERIARELGHESFEAAPPTVRRNIVAALPDGVTVCDGDLWERSFEDLAREVGR